MRLIDVVKPPGSRLCICSDSAASQNQQCGTISSGPLRVLLDELLSPPFIPLLTQRIEPQSDMGAVPGAGELADAELACSSEQARVSAPGFTRTSSEARRKHLGEFVKMPELQDVRHPESFVNEACRAPRKSRKRSASKSSELTPPKKVRHPYGKSFLSRLPWLVVTGAAASTSNAPIARAALAFILATVLLEKRLNLGVFQQASHGRHKQHGNGPKLRDLSRKRKMGILACICLSPGTLMWSSCMVGAHARFHSCAVSSAASCRVYRLAGCTVCLRIQTHCKKAAVACSSSRKAC